MKRLLFLLALGACDKGPPSPYGTKPHILGRAGPLTVFDHHAEVVTKMPDLKDTGVAELHDGEWDYRVFYTQADRVESIVVYHAGNASEVVSAWGRGTPGQLVGGAPATFWFDEAASTSYMVSEGRHPGEFLVDARMYLPLSKIWDRGHDVRVFGLDLIGRPLADDVAAIRKVGLEVELAAPGARRDGILMTDAGPVDWSLEGDPVNKITVQIGPYEIPVNNKAVEALYVEKWGAPTRAQGKLEFHVDPHHVVEFPDKEVWITE